MPNPLPNDVTVLELKELLDSNQPLLLLDCRNQDEYDLVHIPGSKLIPMGELEGRVAELEAHREQRVAVLCHSGGRSQMVSEWLRQQGFTKVQNVLGGIDDWAVRIDNSLLRY